MERKNLAILTPGISSWSVPFVLGAVAAARDQGASLLAYYVQRFALQPLPVGHLDGILSLLDRPGHYYSTFPQLRPLIALTVPTVSIMEGAEGVSWVTQDNRGGIQEAVTHLVRHGHRRIAFIKSTAGPEPALRYQGYLVGLRLNGLPLDPQLVATGDDIDGGREAVRSLLSRRIEFTAVVGCTDWLAIGAIEALRYAGKRIPEDVAVVGFDNFDLRARRFDPPLSSVTLPSFKVGYRALELLMAKIRNPQQQVKRQLVPMHLTPRRSCGCSQPAPDAYPADDPHPLRRLAHELFSCGAELSPGKVRTLADDLGEAVERGESLLRVLDRQFLQASGLGMDPLYCHSFPLMLRRRLEPEARRSAGPLPQEQIAREAHLLHCEVSGHYPCFEEKLRIEFHEICGPIARLWIDFEVEERVVELLRRAAEASGMRFFRLLLKTTPPDGWIDLWEWKQGLGGTIRQSRLLDREFENGDPLPAGGERCSGVLYSLHINLRHVGYLVLDMETPYAGMYGHLADALTQVLYHARHIHDGRRPRGDCETNAAAVEQDR